MDPLQIFLDQVSAAAKGIQSTVQGTDKIGVDRIVGPDAQYGHDGVHAALKEFGDRWQRGVEALLQDAEALSDGLDAAVTSYAKSDQRLADILREHDAGGNR